MERAVTFFQLRSGYEQIMGAAFKERWRREQDFEESLSLVAGEDVAASAAEPKRRRREEQAEEEVKEEEEEQEELPKGDQEMVEVKEEVREEVVEEGFETDWGARPLSQKPLAGLLQQSSQNSTMRWPT